MTHSFTDVISILQRPFESPLYSSTNASTVCTCGFVASSAEEEMIHLFEQSPVLMWDAY